MKKLFKTLMIVALCAATMGITSCGGTDGDGSGNRHGKNKAKSVPEGWVDLGLPSGLLWAECNLGASAPEDYGNYYAWGETQPKNDYRWETYKLGTGCDFWNGSCDKLYKYNTKEKYGAVDNKTTLEAADDAATVALGAGARIPTYEEWVELASNAVFTHSQLLNGVKVVKLTGPNGNSIFLPAAGGMAGDELKLAGRVCCYSSSSLNKDYPDGAEAAFINWSDDSDGKYSNDRRFGFTIRAVRSSY